MLSKSKIEDRRFGVMGSNLNYTFCR